jgi:aminopeptidase N
MQSDESGRVGTLRSTVISMLGRASDADVIKKSYDLFSEYMNDSPSSSIPGDLRSTVFHCALKHDEGVVFAALRSIFEASSSPEEQRDCLDAMGCVRDIDRHATMLEYVYNSGKVRLQDIAIPLGSLAERTDDGGLATWRYFQEHYNELHSRLGSGPMWSACVALSCRGLKTAQEADEIEHFFSGPREPGSAKRRLDQVLEVIRTKAMRRDRDRQAMQSYFAAREGD